MQGKPGPGKDVAGHLIAYLKNNGGRAKINGSLFARNFGFCQGSVNYSLKGLIRNGFVATTTQFKKNMFNCEFFLTEKGESYASPRLLREPRKIGHTPNYALKTSIEKNLGMTLGLNISRELVQVYEQLNQTQQLVLKLQSDKDRLEAKVKELEGEVQLERKAHGRDANDIATLELQLRELRQITNRNSRQVVFDHTGVQI